MLSHGGSSGPTGEVQHTCQNPAGGLYLCDTSLYKHVTQHHPDELPRKTEAPVDARQGTRLTCNGHVFARKEKMLIVVHILGRHSQPRPGIKIHCLIVSIMEPESLSALALCKQKE